MSLVDDLSAGAEEVRETHISWVFLFGSLALKVKKPVSLGFLDFSTLASRRAACEVEATLNARLAPGVYEGVVPVTRGRDGRHRFDGEGEVVDYAVRMRRLPDASRADVLLASGRLEWPALERLAVTLAQFHARAATGAHIDEFGSIACIGGNVRENFAQGHRVLGSLVTEAEQHEVERRQLAFLNEHTALFEHRVAGGRIRDGHGDLRLEHVYLEPGGAPLILDCIEFNERFRYADVCADIAFLSMDLAWNGRVDLAERFLAAYARESDDYDLYGLVDFYESYRAYVRAKVTAIGYSTRKLGYDARVALEEQARRYFMLALACERPPIQPPRLVAVGGIIASGKSTLAEALGAELAAPVISSDRTRKAQSGVSPTTRLGSAPWQDAYSEASTARVYAEVLRRAAIVLESGRSVIVDASFQKQKLREGVKALAAAHGVRFTFVECAVPLDVSRSRLHERALGPSISDGRADVLDEFARRYEPITELDPAEHLRLDTQGPLEASLALCRERL